MQEPLLDHILYLEDRMQKLRGALTSPAIAPRDRDLLEAKVGLINTALDYYRRAHEVELAIRSDEAVEQAQALIAPQARGPKTPQRKQ